MATEALAPSPRSWLGRLVDFLREVRREVDKITWPAWEELKKATWVIIVFVILLGLVIGVMDIVFQFLFVTVPARLF